MVAIRTLIPLTVVAIALGAVMGAITLGLRSAPPVPLPADVTPGEPPAVTRGTPTATERVESGTAEGAPAAPAKGMTQRLDDPDPTVRHDLALELLERGPDALAQARALRPTTPAGQDLQSRLVAAIDKMQLLRRATDYAKLPEHVRLRLDLDAYASVVPERLLVDRRVAYWEREIDAVRYRLERGYAHPAEESVALLELALARREAGEMDASAYGAEARRLLPSIDDWVAGQKAAKGAVPAQIAELEAQVSRLRP